MKTKGNQNQTKVIKTTIYRKAKSKRRIIFVTTFILFYLIRQLTTVQLISREKLMQPNQKQEVVAYYRGGPLDGPDGGIRKCDPDEVTGRGGGVSYRGGSSNGPDESVPKCGLDEVADGGGGGISYRGGSSDGPDGSVSKCGPAEVPGKGARGISNRGGPSDGLDEVTGGCCGSVPKCGE